MLSFQEPKRVTLKEMAMSARGFDEDEQEVENFSVTTINSEVNLSKKLERRRRIEELFEEKRLKEELREFG